jgi:hypothetical protein
VLEINELHMAAAGNISTCGANSTRSVKSLQLMRAFVFACETWPRIRHLYIDYQIN